MNSRDDSRQIFLLVLEFGAEWPHDLDSRGLTDVHAVPQQKGEPNHAFRARIAARLSHVRHEGAMIRAVTLVLNGRLADSDLSARWALAKTLLSVLASTEGAEFILCCTAGSTEWREHVRGLAQALADDGPDTLTVLLQTEPQLNLRGAAPISGVHSAPRRDDARARQAG